MIEREPAPDTAQSLDLETLDRLNAFGANQGKDIYLTSRDDITSNPQWLMGAEDFEATDSHTGAIILVEKGNGVVDAFYFVFWAYNYGGDVLGQNLGTLTASTLHPPKTSSAISSTKVLPSYYFDCQRVSHHEQSEFLASSSAC